MPNDKTCSCVTWALILLGSGCIVGGCMTRYWQGLHNLHFGLWERCIQQVCEKLKPSYRSDQLDVIRALFILAVCFIFLTTLLSIVGLCMKKKFSKTVIVMQILTLFCTLTAMALYTHYMKQSIYEWKWSYVLTWLGCTLFSIGVAMTIVVQCMT